MGTQDESRRRTFLLYAATQVRIWTILINAPWRLNAEGPATNWLPALLKLLESAVLNYQEDLVMPGSSPR